MFEAIIKINVFANFKLWKSFKAALPPPQLFSAITLLSLHLIMCSNIFASQVWRRYVRFGKMALARTALLKNLFFASPLLQNTLFRVGKVCFLWGQ